MQFSEKSRVWIYQSNSPFTANEEADVQNTLDEFTSQWVAHGSQLAAKGEIRYSRFIVLIVDEEQAGATGCSIDKSVQLMKQFEQAYGIDLFDRFNIAFRKDGEIQTASRHEFEMLIRQGEVTEDTVVFNNLVQTKKDLDTNWEVPFKQSWHARVFSLKPQVR